MVMLSRITVENPRPAEDVAVEASVNNVAGRRAKITQLESRLFVLGYCIVADVSRQEKKKKKCFLSCNKLPVTTERLAECKESPDVS